MSIFEVMAKMRMTRFDFWMQVDEGFGQQILGAIRSGAGLVDGGWSESGVAEFCRYASELFADVTVSGTGEDAVFHLSSEIQGTAEVKNICGYVEPLLTTNEIPFRIELRDQGSDDIRETFGTYQPN